MTTSATPHLKRLTPTPDQPSTAKTALAPTGSGAPKVVARQGALSSVGREPVAVGRPHVIGWLHVVCPDDWYAAVSATSHCDCGRHLTAHGRANVIALVQDHVEHRTRCLLHIAPERSRAA